MSDSEVLFQINELMMNFFYDTALSNQKQAIYEKSIVNKQKRPSFRRQNAAFKETIASSVRSPDRIACRPIQAQPVDRLVRSLHPGNHSGSASNGTPRYRQRLL